MAKYGSASFLLLIGGYNMLGAKVQQVTRKVENVLEKSDGLGDGFDEHTPTGKAKGAFGQDGAFFDDATLGMHEALKAAPSTSRVGCVGNTGNTIGQLFTGFAGLIAAAYEVLLQLGGLTKANVQYMVNGHVEEGVILLEHAQKAGNWTSASVDHGASSAAGGSGYLQVTEYAGFTNVVVKIRHSVDDSVYADLATFTTVVAAPTAERVTVEGTVNRYLLTTGTVTGAGTITPMVGFARN